MHFPKKFHFQFISSYRGDHDYEVTASDKSIHTRLHCRETRDEYGSHCNYTREEFESHVNGRIGYITGNEGVLSAELIAAFNRFRYERYSFEVGQILANPVRYGHYTPKPFQVKVGARYDSSNKRWVPLQTFEEIRDMAGIPADKCVNPHAPAVFATELDEIMALAG